MVASIPAAKIPFAGHMSLGIIDLFSLLLRSQARTSRYIILGCNIKGDNFMPRACSVNSWPILTRMLAMAAIKSTPSLSAISNPFRILSWNSIVCAIFGGGVGLKEIYWSRVPNR